MDLSSTSADDIERLADLIRRQHPSLDTILLQPDGEFQTRSLALDVLMREVRDCLSEGFRDRPAEDFPLLYYAWGRCRVGSTALTNLFGVAGMPSYFQPVKAILRHALTGRTGAPWIIPSALDQPHVFGKETAGPYVPAESLFLPLQPLIEAGYPPDKIHIIMLDRDPASSLASWLEKWSDRTPEGTLTRNFVIATMNTLRVESYATRQGIPTTHYVYEASKEAAQSVRILFDRIGLAARFSESAILDWNERGQLESKSSGITFITQPSVYMVPGVHGSDTAYRYRARRTTSLSEAQLNTLERCGVGDVYRASVEACVRDLVLSAETSKRLFGDAIGVAA
ncbi:sulfotransferase family protein [Bradyrhizobium sp.]|uniref:sulfotransferase family protein n=1 Tax=Bradyrhizobium sp. TaxID=376 RepID=UPI003C5FE577